MNRVLCLRSTDLPMLIQRAVSSRSGHRRINPYLLPKIFLTDSKGLHLENQKKNVRIFLGLLLTWIVVLVLFHNNPDWDISAASWFFQAAPCPGETARICGAFPISQNSTFVDLRWILYWFPPVLGISLIIYVFVHWRWIAEPQVKADVHNVLLVIFTWIVSVGFLVNFLFKSYSGRPRPHQTDLFGGLEHFIPAGGFGGTCQSNCSFISGEAASAGWLLTLIPLTPPAMRPVVMPVLIVVSVLTTLLRVSFGGHYLSDAILGWLSAPVIFMLFVCLFGWNGRKG